MHTHVRSTGDVVSNLHLYFKMHTALYGSYFSCEDRLQVRPKGVAWESKCCFAMTFRVCLFRI